MVCVLSLGSAKVARCTNLPDDMKSAAVKEQEEHLRIVGQERSVLRLVVDQARSDLPKMMVLGGGGNRDPSSFDGLAHYSFDFAQQVHYPSNPLQHVPIYLKTLRQ